MYRSQACQDEFVEAALGGKRNGFWLELGGSDGEKISNTFYLEKQLGWRGMTVEIDGEHAASYRAAGRKATHLMIGDAAAVDYPQALKDCDAPAPPAAIDYLQIDLDPENGSTLRALKLLERDVMPERTFSVVTFEHDVYCCDSEKVREPSRELFARNGYVLLFPDVLAVWRSKFIAFEDWYVHPSAVKAKALHELMQERPGMRRIRNDVLPQGLKEGLMPEDCVALTKKHFW